MDVLLTAFARHLGCSADEARPVLADMLAHLHSSVQNQGEVVLDEVGTFRLQGDQIHFEPTTGLLGVVNRSFAGLPPLMPASTPVEPVPEAAPPPTLSSSAPVPSETPPLVSVPLEPVDPNPLVPVPQAAEAAAAVAAVLDWQPGPDWLALDADPVPEAPDEPEAPAFPTTGFFEAEPDPDTVPSQEAPSPSPPTDEPEAPTWAPLSAPSASPPLPEVNTSFEVTETTPSPESEMAPVAEAAPSLDESTTSDTAPVPVESDPHATLDDDLDALLAGVWAPGESPVPEHPLGPESEPSIEDAEYEVVASAPDMPAVSEAPAPRSEPFPPASPPRAASTIDPLFSKRTPRPPRPSPLAITRPLPPEPEEEPTRRNLLIWLLPLLALAAVLTFVLWPRLSSAPDRAPADTFAEQTPSEGNGGGATSSEALPTEADPGETERAEADPDGIDDPSDASTDATGSVAPARGAAPPPSSPPAQTTTTAPPTSAPLTAPGTIPLPLRGPTRVDPARGGVTWIIASGSATGAQRLSEQYRQLGYMTAVLPAQNRGRVVYRVALGQFIDRDEALRFRELLPAGIPFNEIWIHDFSASS